jgi:uncharacterized protein (TIGR03437 family)
MKTVLLVLVSALSLCAQVVDLKSPTGRYHFVELAITGSDSGQPVETQNIGGDLVFDEAGAFRLTAQRGLGTGAATSFETTGSYTVAPFGVFIISDPANGDLNLNLRLGAGGDVLIGSSVDAADGTHDLLIGVRSVDWKAGPPESYLSGSYAGASFLLPDGLIDSLTTAFVELNADGAGRFSTVIATGQSPNQKNLTKRQTIAGAQYSLRADGTGSATFGDSATLLAGTRQILVSWDGNIILGFSPDAGRREILVAVRQSTPESVDDWQRKWWIGEMLADNDIAGTIRVEASLGAMDVDGTGGVRMSLLRDPGEAVRAVTALNFVAIGADGTAQLGPFLEDGKSNLAIGATTFVGAEVGVVGANHRVHGILFGVHAQGGPALDVRNAASLAPNITPVSAGELITVRGAGLANATASAPGGQPVYELSGVHVTINTAACPLVFVSPDQINLEAPASLVGDTASITLWQGNTDSKVVTAPLSATSPGIFTVDGSGVGLAAASHADGSLVSGDSPAAAGETVTVPVTGLGAALPPLSSLRAFVGEYQADVVQVDSLPSVPGAYRVLIVVPATAPSGKTVPLALSSGTAFTSLVDIAIR